MKNNLTVFHTLENVISVNYLQEKSEFNLNHFEEGKFLDAKNSRNIEYQREISLIQQELSKI